MIRSVYYKNYKGQERALDLQRLNLITGPNGSGKTTVYEAIYVAIKGKHPALGDNLAAIRKQVSGDPAIFELIDDAITIRREISFGEKTVHKVYLNGVEARIKEGQQAIDAIFPDAMMRLDIGKFSKMGDIERGQVLSELLGSAKENASDIAVDILDMFFRANPEAEYLIKWKLGKTVENYDKPAFIAAMKEHYTDKNPVLLEMVGTCERIMAAHQGLVDLTAMLDEVYDAVTKYRNAKAQEKLAAQKAFAEISTDNIDPNELAERIRATEGSVTALDDHIRALQTFLDTLKAMRPQSPLDELDARIEHLDKQIAKGDKDKKALEAQAVEIEAKVNAINADLAEHKRHDDWLARGQGYKKDLAALQTEIVGYQEAMQPESKAKIKDLDLARGEYRALKALSPGECPTCGTIITDEAVGIRKQQIKDAKAKADAADQEIQLRNENAMNEARIEMAEKRIKEIKANASAHRTQEPAAPKTKAAELQQEAQTLRINREDLVRQIGELGKAVQDLRTERTIAGQEKNKHGQYAAEIEKNASLLNAIEGEDTRPEDRLENAIQISRSNSAELHDQLVKYQVAQQLNERLATEQQRILDLQASYDILKSFAETARKYKNAAISRKIEPVQLLAKKYYHNQTDEVIVMPQQIGVNRRGAFIEQGAMSSGESLSLLSAILIAIMETSGAQPSYLFVDAAEIDANNMHILLDALAKSNLSTIAVAHHMDLAAEGWNHITL